jgi:hypothetical protein
MSSGIWLKSINIIITNQFEQTSIPYAGMSVFWQFESLDGDLKES